MKKRALFVLMPERFQDHEFYVPFTILSKRGYSVDVAGLQPGVAVGAFGLKHTPNLLFDELTHSDFLQQDALIIPGGPASTTYLWHNKKLQETVRFFHEQGKVVATICYACIVPVQAGILAGKKATVFPTDEAKAVFKEHHVEFMFDGCVALSKEKIITAQGPTFAKTFGQAIVDMLESEKKVL